LNFSRAIRPSNNAGHDSPRSPFQFQIQ
jgi:hypothetical protein